MIREEAKTIIEKFINDKLLKNQNDEYIDNCIKLYTSRGKEFIIYKKNQEKSIYVKPKDGNENFSEPIDRILDYYIDNKTDHHADKSYVIPISNEIFKTNGNSLQDNKKRIDIKNIILYGAPGVGKTHNYQRIISMIENGENEKKIFDTITDNKSSLHVELHDETFKNIKDDKRVEFVTFHQSYSYEDFIEGFRPQESRNIELEDGIFKVIAERAQVSLSNSKKTSTYIINIDELIQKFTNFIQDSLDKEEIFILGDKITIASINERGSFLLGGSIKNDTQRLTMDMVKRDYEDYKDGNIKSYEDVKPKFESQRSFHGNARYYFMLYKKIYEFEKSLSYSEIKQEKETQKNFYIVIDEINRGNISKIFGELITLIEEDKRDKYEVTLPYSKTKFKVPSNLYIIATMNSTDKSIATIDIALRRRFTFLKMKPNLELVENDEARKLMEELNTFIKENLGEDYMLGHSYFMGEKIDLEFVKEYKIKPLLEEYFYADADKLKEVLEIFDSLHVNN